MELQQLLFDNVSIVADGANYAATFSEQTGTPVAIVDSTMTISQPGGRVRAAVDLPGIARIDRTEGGRGGG